VSPWWLRPPGEESDENDAPAAGNAAEAPEAVEPRVPSIADLVAGREAAPEPPAPIEDDERFEPIERYPPEAAESGSEAGAPPLFDAASPAPLAEDEVEGEPENGESAEPAGTAETPERGPRRRRRRGGRGRGRSAAAAAANAGASAAENRQVAPPDWDDDEDDDDEESEGAALTRELLMSMPVSSPRTAAAEEERKIAMFCDLENVALGVRDSEIKKFDIHLVLERLVEKGKIIVKRAYADWDRYSEFKQAFHEAAIELIEIPQRRYTGKNSADIKMVVDAMDLCYAKEHLDTFVLLSGDSDFSPLVSKLKENNKYVIGVGVKNSSSNLLIDNCDEFIFYEDIWREQQKGPELTGLTKKKAEVFTLMTESIVALQRENKDVLWGSMVKQTMQRKKPSFNEGYYGYSTFSELLQDAERHGIVKLRKDERSGSWVVTGFPKKR
jgi:uncharacterized protein (TIGR00288 family)